MKNEKQSFKMLCMTRIYKRLMYSSLFYTQQPTAKKAWLHTTLPHYSSVRTFHDRPVRQARGIILTIFSCKQKKINVKQKPCNQHKRTKCVTKSEVNDFRYESHTNKCQPQDPTVCSPHSPKATRFRTTPSLLFSDTSRENVKKKAKDTSTGT